MSSALKSENTNFRYIEILIFKLTYELSNKESNTIPAILFEIVFGDAMCKRSNGLYIHF